jgi:hypothetical protein
MRLRVTLVLCFSALVACAAMIPRAEVDRCNIGIADGNDAFTVRQGAACRMVAQRLTAAERPTDAVGYARKACALEDAKGCEQYLALVRGGQPSIQLDELPRARAAGEKACAGMVVASDAADVRPAICARTAELYVDLAPRSPADAGRLYARACKLGDSASCSRAKSLGADTERASATAPKASSESAPLLGPEAGVVPAPAAPVCHEMRACVVLDVQQRNTTEVVGSIRSRCDRPVTCTWCPARRDQVDKGACRTATLVPNESKTGRDSGLWYDGYNAIAYDCVDAGDDRGCLSM